MHFINLYHHFSEAPASSISKSLSKFGGSCQVFSKRPWVRIPTEVPHCHASSGVYLPFTKGLWVVIVTPLIIGVKKNTSCLFFSFIYKGPILSAVLRKPSQYCEHTTGGVPASAGRSSRSAMINIQECLKMGTAWHRGRADKGLAHSGEVLFAGRFEMRGGIVGRKVSRKARKGSRWGHQSRIKVNYNIAQRIAQSSCSPTYSTYRSSFLGVIIRAEFFQKVTE